MQIIRWAGNALAALLKDVSVNHGRGDIVVPQQLLNQIIPAAHPMEQNKTPDPINVAAFGVD